MSRIIVKNIPKESTELQLKSHFSKHGEITDIKIMRKQTGESRRFAFIGFKTEEQAKKSLSYYNNTYLKTCRIQVEDAKVQGDPSLNKGMIRKGANQTKIIQEVEESDDKDKKIKKLLELAKEMSSKNKFDAIQQKMREDNSKDTNISNDIKDKNLETNKIEIDSSLPILTNDKKINPKRLYLRNLAFEVKEEDLRETFEKFGDLIEVHVPINHHSNQSFGYAYLTYATVESAVMAISQMDKSVYQGRILHITSALEKEEKVIMPKLNDKKSASNMSDFKKLKKENKKNDYSNETNWNYLFMNQNAVIESVSKKLNISKSELMSRDNPNLAVQVAAMETTIINETKEWLNSQGINLDSLKGKRTGCSRSKNIILIKNISSSVNKEKLEEYFSRYGMLVRFLLSPSNTLGIAEYVDKKHAENCIKKLSYYEFEGVPLYLEFAPEGLLTKQSTNSKTEENKNNEIDLKLGKGKILFVTNLNFSTKENRLKKFLEEKGFPPVNVKIVTHKKEESQKLLSSGFGFIEFESEEIAQKAIRNLQGILLDGHSIKLNIAKTTNQPTEKDTFLKNKRKIESDLNDYEFEGEEVVNNKILVKNLAF